MVWCQGKTGKMQILAIKHGVFGAPDRPRPNTEKGGGNYTCFKTLRCYCVRVTFRPVELLRPVFQCAPAITCPVKKRREVELDTVMRLWGKEKRCCLTALFLYITILRNHWGWLVMPPHMGWRQLFPMLWKMEKSIKSHLHHTLAMAENKDLQVEKEVLVIIYGVRKS